MGSWLMAVLTDPMVIGTAAAAVFGLLGWLFRQSSKSKAIMNMAFMAFGAVEKLIPDNTENKALAKTDKALKIFTVLYLDAFGKEPPASVVDLVKGLWAAWARQHKVLAAMVK